MQKVVRTEEKFLAAEAERKQNEERTKKMSGKNQPKKIVPKRSGILTLSEIKARAHKKDRKAKEEYKNRMKQVKEKATMRKNIQQGRLSDPFARNQMLRSAKMSSLMWARQSSKRRKRDDDAPSSDDDVLDSIYRDGTDEEDSSADSSSEEDSDYGALMDRTPPKSPRRKENVPSRPQPRPQRSVSRPSRNLREANYSEDEDEDEDEGCRSDRDDRDYDDTSDGGDSRDGDRAHSDRESDFRESDSDGAASASDVDASEASDASDPEA